MSLIVALALLQNAKYLKLNWILVFQCFAFFFLWNLSTTAGRITMKLCTDIVWILFIFLFCRKTLWHKPQKQKLFFFFCFALFYRRQLLNNTTTMSVSFLQDRSWPDYDHLSELCVSVCHLLCHNVVSPYFFLFFWVTIHQHSCPSCHADKWEEFDINADILFTLEKQHWTL